MPSPRPFKGFTIPPQGLPGSGGVPEVTTQGLTPPSSPPLAAQACANDLSTASAPRSSSSSLRTQRGNGGAAHIITEECERLFCETLSAVFLGEREPAQHSLGMGARKHRYSAASSAGSLDTNDGNLEAIADTRQASWGQTGQDLPSPPLDIAVRGIERRAADCRVSHWLEIWDYAGGAMFRGFTAEGLHGDRTLFVFFEKNVIGRDLKQGLMALIELASAPNIACEQAVVCFDRSEDSSPPSRSLLRDLGWVGFELATLAHWAGGIDLTSERWLFLGMEV